MAFGDVITADGPSLASALRDHDRHEARMCVAIGEFDKCELWDIAGCASAFEWLKNQGMHQRDAYEMVKLGRKLRRMPGTAAAWIEGTLSGGQVRIICGLVIDRHLRLFGEHEAELLPHLATLTVDETLSAMRLWRDRADALDPGNAPADDACSATLSRTMDDRGVLNASLDAEGYALWYEAFRLADSGAYDMPASLRQGEAMKDIARFFIKNQDTKTPRRHVPHVKVIVDAATLGTDHVHGYDESTGMTLPPETLRRILCDCVMHRVVMADGIVLDYGRAVKEPPPELAHAVAVRDQGCRWKNCDRPVGWCDIHHVKEWIKHFGPTALWNLILLCDKHHDVLHRRGWLAKLDANGDFTVTTPWGESWTTHAPGRLRRQLPLPRGGGGTDEFDSDMEDESPWDDHRELVELAVGARRRFEQLFADARCARAIASLAVLTRAA